MAEHIINDKKIADGSMVTYYDHTGTKHKAVVKKIKAIYTADLEAHVNGADRFIESVPFSSEATNHGWTHMDDEERTEMERGDAGSTPSDQQSPVPPFGKKSKDI